MDKIEIRTTNRAISTIQYQYDKMQAEVECKKPIARRDYLVTDLTKTIEGPFKNYQLLKIKPKVDTSNILAEHQTEEIILP